jgi:hypothetical protein
MPCGIRKHGAAAGLAGVVPVFLRSSGVVCARRRSAREQGLKFSVKGVICEIELADTSSLS